MIWRTQKVSGELSEGDREADESIQGIRWTKGFNQKFPDLTIDVVAGPGSGSIDCKCGFPGEGAFGLDITTRARGSH